MDANAISNFLKELTNAIQVDSYQAFDIQRDEMLTMDDVCKRLQVHRNTLSGWLKTGKFPKPIMVCGQKRWSSSSINSAIYEENPHLRERDHLLAEARRVSCNETQGNVSA